MFALSTLIQNRIKNGRLFVYEKDTTTLAPVFTLEGSVYTEAPNPIYVVAGITDNTYFLENRIYDVVAQEYLGDSSDPTGDLRPEVWEQAFTTKIGFEYDKDIKIEDYSTVVTIDGLKALSAGGYAQVIGYWTETDCEPRMYYWDETCVNDADDGLIVASNDEDIGRWILLTNGVMKSEYYGVYGNSQGTPQGHEENLVNLFTYLNVYGTDSLSSPKVILLASGLYGDTYSIYSAYGKKVIFAPGARLRVGNCIKCLSYEGAGVLGAVRVGYNINGQVDVNYCSVPTRLTNFANLIDFLNSNSTELIFDLEWDYDNPTSEGEKLHLGTTKTLTNVHCVFEKPFGFWSDAGESANLVFNNCAIESEHKIRKFLDIHFKNTRVRDSWFEQGWRIQPSDMDTDNEYLPQNFEYVESYFAYKTIGSPSDVELNCYGQTLKEPLTFTYAGLNTLTVNGLKDTVNSVTIGCPSAVLNDCKLNSAYISSPNLSAIGTDVEYGYLTANNGTVNRYFDGCRFGGYNKTDFRIEGASAINLYVRNCDFKHRYQPFYSNEGLNLGTGSKTYFYNNVGIGDGPSPTVYYAGVNTQPVSIVSGLLTWEDEVGSVNWVSGKTTYQMTPWRVDTYQKQMDRYEYVNRNFNGYLANGSYITTSSTPGYPWLVYTNDFKRVNGLVFDLQKQCFSANFYPSGHGSSFEIENESVRYLGTVTLCKNERG